MINGALVRRLDPVLDPVQVLDSKQWSVLFFQGGIIIDGLNLVFFNSIKKSTSAYPQIFQGFLGGHCLFRGFAGHNSLISLTPDMVASYNMVEVFGMIDLRYTFQPLQSYCTYCHFGTQGRSDVKTHKPLLLDLFCGAGGCSEGYYQAGFEVIGVDIEPQMHNPHTFYQGDALQVLDLLLSGQEWHGYRLTDFSAIHASPPCQSYSRSKSLAKVTAKNYKPAPMLIEPVRQRLEATGLVWVIENVEGAPLPDALELCGSMFGLPIQRHRWFSCSHLLFAPGPCKHAKDFYNVWGHDVRGYGAFAGNVTYQDRKGAIRRRPGYAHLKDGQKAMGISWMTIKEMAQAIPPAYTRYIGQQLLAYVGSEVMTV